MLLLMAYNLATLSHVIETKKVTDAARVVFRRKKVLKEKWGQDMEM